LAQHGGGEHHLRAWHHPHEGVWARVKARLCAAPSAGLVCTACQRRGECGVAAGSWRGTRWYCAVLVTYPVGRGKLDRAEEKRAMRRRHALSHHLQVR
jgi:hypothetical protein